MIGHHFGLYHMMSGAQYNVSLLQVLESKRRIKLANILNLFARQHLERPSLQTFLKPSIQLKNVIPFLNRT